MESWILWVSCKVNIFARDLKYSWFHEHSKNLIHFLNKTNYIPQLSRVVGVSTLDTNLSFNLMKFYQYQVSSCIKFKWKRFYQRAVTPINSSNHNIPGTCILLYFIWVTTYHQITPLQVSGIIIIINHMSSDMWFPTMWHFDMCRLRRACVASV